ncbi:hypothetical protein F5Y19DRAFT_276441 [Xylariaceae sp. FL1651]|nr:hypothetical protein F5Y19DRAFT_276441 [Xylariaceae sp. FL1651]
MRLSKRPKTPWITSYHRPSRVRYSSQPACRLLVFFAISPSLPPTFLVSVNGFFKHSCLSFISPGTSPLRLIVTQLLSRMLRKRRKKKFRRAGGVVRLRLTTNSSPA